MRLVSRSEEDTVKQGELYSAGLKEGDIIGLDGNLGTGKTQFVKGIAMGFRVREIVNSPTFIIVNEYEGYIENRLIKIYHFDLYRLKSGAELEVIGFNEYG